MSNEEKGLLGSIEGILGRLLERTERIEDEVGKLRKDVNGNGDSDDVGIKGRVAALEKLFDTLQKTLQRDGKLWGISPLWILVFALLALLAASLGLLDLGQVISHLPGQGG